MTKPRHRVIRVMILSLALCGCPGTPGVVPGSSIAPVLTWQEIPAPTGAPDRLFRAWVPTGWILKTRGFHDDNLLFVPDPKHEWRTKWTTKSH